MSQSDVLIEKGQNNVHTENENELWWFEENIYKGNEENVEHNFDVLAKTSSKVLFLSSGKKRRTKKNMVWYSLPYFVMYKHEIQQCSSGMDIFFSYLMAWYELLRVWVMLEDFQRQGLRT